MAKKNGKNAVPGNDPRLVKLLREYDALAKERSEAEQMVEQAADKLSAVSRQLIELTDGEPIQRKSGARMLPMVRPSEKEAAKLREEGKPVPATRWFFRTEGSGGVEASV